MQAGGPVTRAGPALSFRAGQHIGVPARAIRSAFSLPQIAHLSPRRVRSLVPLGCCARTCPAQPVALQARGVPAGALSAPAEQPRQGN